METATPKVPLHVGFIVDGNRRWAKKHGLPGYEGHLAGRTVLQDILPYIVDQGVKYVSLYLFSTENWSRSQDEVQRLMKLIVKILSEDIKEFIKQDVRLRVLGTRDRLSDEVIKAIDAAEAQTKDCQRATVAICFNYGGQLEIADAAEACRQAGIAPITEEAIANHLYAPDIPAIDIIVRTSGEQRLSNFMLWRAAYSELLFMPVLWPDLRRSHIDKILNEYAKRNRRFGGK